MRALLLLAVMAGCGEPAAQADPGGAPRPARKLVEDARWDQVAAPIAFAPDGKRWVGVIGYDLVTFAGAREVARMTGVGVYGRPLQPLAGGGWFSGSSVVDASGTVRFSGDQLGQRYGRFGSAKAMAVSPEGRVVIVDGADSPSACLCDRERGTGGSAAGELVRVTLSVEGAPRERVLLAHGGHEEFQLAASREWLAAADGRELKIWSATGDDPPTVIPIEGISGLRHLAWVGERYLVATRYTDGEHDEVLVFDRDLAYRRTSFVVDGNVQALAVRPGGGELAIATNRYRATTTVEVDVKAIVIVDLAGAIHARAVVDGTPIAVAWRADGKALLATLSSRSGAVVRYTVR